MGVQLFSDKALSFIIIVITTIITCIGILINMIMITIINHDEVYWQHYY